MLQADLIREALAGYARANEVIEYDFDYDKAKPNRFAARLINKPTVVMRDLDTTPCPSN